MREFNLNSGSKDTSPKKLDMKGTSSAADSLFNKPAPVSGLFDNAFMGTNAASLKLEALKKEGVRVLMSGDDYNLVIPANLTASQVFKLVSSYNPDIEINYSEDLDEKAEVLAKKTKKPLWNFESEGNTITLKRMF